MEQSNHLQMICYGSMRNKVIKESHHLVFYNSCNWRYFVIKFRALITKLLMWLTDFWANFELFFHLWRPPSVHSSAYWRMMRWTDLTELENQNMQPGAPNLGGGKREEAAQKLSFLFWGPFNVLHNITFNKWIIDMIWAWICI